MLAISFLFLKLLMLHPFHVSVCDMEYKTDDKHLKISVRLFLDDLEVALKPASGLPRYDITDTTQWNVTQAILKTYLQNNLRLKADGHQIAITYLGSELEGDAMWCYLEVKNLKKFNNMTVYYTALTEEFDDQENLVHIRRNGVVRSCRTHKDKVQDTLSWD